MHSRGVSGQEARRKRGFPGIKCQVLTFVPHCGFQNLIFSSLPNQIIKKVAFNSTETSMNVTLHIVFIHFFCLTVSCVPLQVLIQAADDLVPLIDDGHQLIHQPLLLSSVILSPVTLCGKTSVLCLKKKKQGTVRHYRTRPAFRELHPVRFL